MDKYARVLPMDKRIYKMHSEICKVFTSPVRAEILHILRNGKKTVSELVEITGHAQPNISQHLHLMKEKKIVKTERQGNSVYYILTNPKISKAFDIIEEILQDQLAESESVYKSMIV
jgi:ArsR family transcriptional regulator